MIKSPYIKNGIEGYVVEFANGEKRYFYNNQLHNEDGPAIISSNGYRVWYINGKKHRVDGPARIFSDGSQEWYYHGERIYVKSQEEFERYLKLLVFL